MSARDIIRQIEALPLNEQREVMEYFGKSPDAKPAEAKREPMSVDDAIDHVFKNYDGLLAKLAK